MLARSSVLIIDPQGATRTRLSEVLRNVVLHLDAEVAGTFSDGLLQLRCRPRDAVLISSGYSIQEIRTLFEVLQNGRDTRVIVVVRGRKQDASYLAMLFLLGVNGFLLEPYSAEQLETLLSLAQEMSPEQFEGAFRGKAAYSILLSEAALHLDCLSEQIARGETPHGRELRAFRRVSEMLKHLTRQNMEEYEAALCATFERAAPSRSAELKKKHSKKRRAETHPGRYVKDQLSRRGLEVTKVAELLHMDIEELQAFLDESRSINPELAHGLSRVLGETPQFWLSLQNRFNRSQVAKNAGSVAS